MKKNHLYCYMLLGLAAGLSQSCDSINNCIDGNGILETEERIVREFYGVENATSFDVEIVSDSVYLVEVTADENLLSFIETTVRNGDLYISVQERRCINSRENVSIELHVPTLDKIVSSGSGDMDVNRLDCNTLRVTNSGSGDIDIADVFCTGTVDVVVSGSGNVDIWGKTDAVDHRLSGSGDILADDLLAVDCSVNSTGSGDVYCFAYESLDVHMSGSGDVIYYGNPRVSSSINGSGDLHHRD